MPDTKPKRNQNQMNTKTTTRKQQTYAGWKAAAKKAGAVRFEGDKDIANAFASDGFGVGEWDGAEGEIFSRAE